MDPFSSKILGLISRTGHAGVSFTIISITRLRPQHSQAAKNYTLKSRKMLEYEKGEEERERQTKRKDWAEA